MQECSGFGGAGDGRAGRGERRGRQQAPHPSPSPRAPAPPSTPSTRLVQLGELLLWRQVSTQVSPHVSRHPCLALALLLLLAARCGLHIAAGAAALGLGAALAHCSVRRRGRGRQRVGGDALLCINRPHEAASQRQVGRKLGGAPAQRGRQRRRRAALAAFGLLLCRAFCVAVGPRRRRLGSVHCSTGGARRWAVGGSGRSAASPCLPVLS